MDIFGHAPFKNDPVIANQRTKFNIFLIIIDLECPENVTAVVWFRSGKKPRTSSQKYVFNIFVNNY